MKFALVFVAISALPVMAQDLVFSPEATVSCLEDPTFNVSDCVGAAAQACMYEYSQWGGGTGGGPAHAACLNDITARQAIALENRTQDH